MIRLTIGWLIFSTILFSPSQDYLKAADPPSINDPPIFQSDPSLLNSNRTISNENVSRLVQAGEVRFSPWHLVTALAWSPGGEFIAVAAGESIFLLHVQSWRLFSSYRIGALVSRLAFSPDGSWLAVGSRDGQVRLWHQPLPASPQSEMPKPSFVIQAHKKGVNDLAFSSDGLLLATGGNDAVARFWDLTTGKSLGLMIGGTFAVPSIAFTPDGASLAVANGRMVRLRQIGSERILGSFQAKNSLFSLAYNQDGTWLAAGDTQNQVLLWDPSKAFRTGQEIYAEPIPLIAHQGSLGTYQALIWDLAFCPGSQLLASAGGDSTVRIWDINSTLLLATLKRHTLAVTDVEFNSSSTALASAGLDGRIIVWKVTP